MLSNCFNNEHVVDGGSCSFNVKLYLYSTILQHNVLRTENMSNVPPEGDTIYALLNSVFTSLFVQKMFDFDLLLIHF